MEDLIKFKPRGARLSKLEKSFLFNNGFSWCNNCKKSLPINCFGKDRSTKYGIESRCKECNNLRFEIKQELDPETVKQTRLRHRNKRLDYYQKQSNNWKRDNRGKVNDYRRKIYAENPTYRLTVICRTMLNRAYKRIGTVKEEKTIKFLGYSAKDLKAHIEKQFVDNMNWDNHGEWHIDHIIPISRAETYEEAKVLSQLTNLQPLWAEDNLSKGSKIN